MQMKRRMTAQEAAEYRQTPEWKEMALKCKEHQDWKCWLCGKDHLPLDTHHITYKREGGEEIPDDLMALCNPCHFKLHRDVEEIAPRVNEVKAQAEAALQTLCKEIKKMLQEAAKPIVEEYKNSQGDILAEMLQSYEGAAIGKANRAAREMLDIDWASSELGQWREIEFRFYGYTGKNEDLHKIAGQKAKELRKKVNRRAKAHEN